MIEKATIINNETGARETCRAYTGEIVGASFYDDEKGEIRPAPRLYIDMDENILVGHHRVAIIEIPADKEGTQE